MGGTGLEDGGGGGGVVLPVVDVESAMVEEEAVPLYGAAEMAEAAPAAREAVMRFRGRRRAMAATVVWWDCEVTLTYHLGDWSRWWLPENARAVDEKIEDLEIEFDHGYQRWREVMGSERAKPMRKEWEKTLWGRTEARLKRDLERARGLKVLRELFFWADGIMRGWDGEFLDVVDAEVLDALVSAGWTFHNRTKVGGGRGGRVKKKQIDA